MRKGKNKRNKSLLLAEYNVKQVPSGNAPTILNVKPSRKKKAIKREIWNISFCTWKRPKRDSFGITKVASKNEKKSLYFLLSTCCHIKYWQSLINIFCNIFLLKNFSFLKNPYSQFYPILKICYQVQLQKNLENRFKENFRSVGFGTKNGSFTQFWA